MHLKYSSLKPVYYAATDSSVCPGVSYPPSDKPISKFPSGEAGTDEDDITTRGISATAAFLLTSLSPQKKIKKATKAFAQNSGPAQAFVALKFLTDTSTAGNTFTNYGMHARRLIPKWPGCLW